MDALSTKTLTEEQVADFRRDGAVRIPGFYDRKCQIEPIQRAIHGIIGLLIAKHDLPITQAPFEPDTFDSGYAQLIAHDRTIGGEVYDAVKQIPVFVRLVACEQHEALLCQLRGSQLPGVAAGGYGIRIDNPGEERFRANWHQDYHAQLQSLDGLVFWSPLLPITADQGPVEVCLGSHTLGQARVHTIDNRNAQKTGAYALTLENETELIDRFEQAAPLPEPGDLIVLDYLVLHQSGFNRSTRSRWSMQMRFFNFEEPAGIRDGWQGCFARGIHLAAAHPELIAS